MMCPVPECRYSGAGFLYLKDALEEIFGRDLEKEEERMEFITGVKEKKTLGLSELLAGDRIGACVKVEGAVHTIRHMGDVAFVMLRKSQGLLQCVYEKREGEENK